MENKVIRIEKGIGKNESNKKVEVPAMSVPVKVECTSDYGKFRYYLENRDVRPGKLQRLKEAITKRNYLHLFPIIVDKKGRIWDGQHRWIAAKELSLPFYYIVDEHVDSTTISDVQNAQDKWKPEDFVKFFARNNLKNYLLLEKFIKTYGFSVTESMYILGCKGCKGGERGYLKDGTLTIDDYSEACKIAEHLQKFASPFFNKEWRTKFFIQAITQLWQHKDYDPEMMIAKLNYQRTKLVTCPNVKEYKKLLRNIFNFRSRKPVSFDLV